MKLEPCWRGKQWMEYDIYMVYGTLWTIYHSPSNLTDVVFSRPNLQDDLKQFAIK